MRKLFLNNDWLKPLFIVIVGWLVRWGQFFGCEPFRDEPGTYTLALFSPWERLSQPHETGFFEINGSFYYTLQHYWQVFCDQVLLSPTIDAYRGSSLIIGLTSLVALYYLGKRLVGPQAAFIASLFLAINPFHQYFSNYLRFQMASLLAAIICWQLFLNLTKHESGKNWCFFLIATLLSVFISLPNICLLPAQALYFLLQKQGSRSAWRQVAWLSLAALLLGLVFPYCDPQGSQRIAWYPPLNSALFAGIVCCGIGIKQYLLCPFTFIAFSGLLIAAAGGLISLVQHCRKLYQLSISSPSLAESSEPDTVLGRKRPLIWPESLSIILWLFVPFVSMLIISLGWQNIIIARSCLFIQPALALLIGVGTVRLSQSRRGAWLTIAVSAIVMAVLLSQCRHNVYYEWDEPLKAQAFSSYKEGCCQFPFDHLQPGVFPPQP